MLSKIKVGLESLIKALKISPNWKLKIQTNINEKCVTLKHFCNGGGN